MNFKGFIDTTLRDGAASPLLFDARKYYFRREEKIKIVETLIKLGVRHLEFFSPIVGSEEKKDFQAIREFVENNFDFKVYFLAHCRCRNEDIQGAIKAGFDGLNLYLGLSKTAQETYGKTLSQLVEIVKKIVRSIRKEYPNLWLRYSGEDAFRTPLARLCQVYDQIADYVDVLGAPDTTGLATPEVVKKKIRILKTKYPHHKLECHFHNDRGLALINSLTAINCGADYIDTSVWGMAERSGITSITGIIFNLYQENPNLVSDYQLGLCYLLNVLMGSILRLQVPYNEPVSLTNRTHIAGVHQKAVLNNQVSYEAHNLAKFGVNKEQLLLGPLTGWNFVYYYLKEIGNFVISTKKAKEIAREFKELIRELRQELAPDELLFRIAENHKLSKIKVPAKYQKRRLEDLSS